MDLRQSQTVSQRLTMTAEMQQSLAVLQMPVTELMTAIQKELDENPVLEGDFHEREPDILEAFVSMASDVGYDRNEVIFEEEKEHPINYAVKKRTLKDFLYEQAGYLKESERNSTVISYMIENIDGRGYLGCGIEEIAEDLGVSQEEALYCLKIVQEFQPDGVFARDLRECLMIQLRKRNMTDPVTYRIVESCLPLLSENKISAIAQKNRISLSQAADCCSLIKTLEPKPSRGFAGEESDAYLIPEATIMRDGERLVISLNEHALPQLKISGYYKELYHAGMQPETKRYMRERLHAALSLMKCIEQRKNTIYNILQSVINLQKDFLLKGQQYLKPMTIRTVAQQIGCHESTVSRAIRDKYIQTPYGLLRMKDLFTSGYGRQELSAAVIKRELQSLINGEAKESPLSDQQIVSLLTEKGVEISRRTVAKYRMEMDIPSSSRRKIFK